MAKGKTSLTGSNRIGDRALSRRATNTIGYVVIPVDRDREEFINYCKRTNTVAVMTENSEFIRNVKVGRMMMDWIQFPSKTEGNATPELGDAVLLSSIYLHNKPVVVEIFSKVQDYGSGKEHDFTIGKEYKDVDVSISGDAESGSLSMDVDAGSKEGSLNINLTNNSKNCKVKVFCQGDVEISSRDDSNQSLISVSPNEIQLKSEEGTIKHNEGSESMVLGDTLREDILDVAFDLLIQTTVPTMLGAQKLSSFIDFQKLKSKTMTILSGKSKLD